VKTGVRAVSSNGVAGQVKPETVSTTPVKAWVSIISRIGQGEKDTGYYELRRDAYSGLGGRWRGQDGR
jgi:hypothetical protein